MATATNTPGIMLLDSAGQSIVDAKNAAGAEPTPQQSAMTPSRRAPLAELTSNAKVTPRSSAKSRLQLAPSPLLKSGVSSPHGAGHGRKRTIDEMEGQEEKSRDTGATCGAGLAIETSAGNDIGGTDGGDVVMREADVASLPQQRQHKVELDGSIASHAQPLWSPPLEYGLAAGSDNPTFASSTADPNATRLSAAVLAFPSSVPGLLSQNTCLASFSSLIDYEPAADGTSATASANASESSSSRRRVSNALNHGPDPIAAAAATSIRRKEMVEGVSTPTPLLLASEDSCVSGDTIEIDDTPMTEATLDPTSSGTVRSQAATLRSRLRLAMYKVRTNQTGVPFAQLLTPQFPNLDERQRPTSHHLPDTDPILSSTASNTPTQADVAPAAAPVVNKPSLGLGAFPSLNPTPYSSRFVQDPSPADNDDQVPSSPPQVTDDDDDEDAVDANNDDDDDDNYDDYNDAAPRRDSAAPAISTQTHTPISKPSSGLGTRPTAAPATFSSSPLKAPAAAAAAATATASDETALTSSVVKGRAADGLLNLRRGLVSGSGSGSGSGSKSGTGAMLFGS